MAPWQCSLHRRPRRSIRPSASRSSRRAYPSASCTSSLGPHLRSLAVADDGEGGAPARRLAADALSFAALLPWRSAFAAIATVVHHFVRPVIGGLAGLRT